MKRLLVLASGRGSNFRAILEAVKHGVLRAEIVGLGVSKRDSGAVGIAEAHGLPTLLVPSEDEILAFVKRERVDAIVLAGYMKILTEAFIEAMRDPKGISRIVNIHPSLLPAFPGMNAYEQAFDAGVREAGITVHLVEKDVDGGPILDQKSFRIDRLRSAEEVESRGLPVEHDLYARTIDWFVNGDYRTEMRNGRFHVERA
jgi:phosphoribosylglycinamide formyltransferase-1